MTIPTPTRLVDGDPMDWAAAHNLINSYGNWLNEIPLADIADEAVVTEHIVRPRVFGFPSNEFRGARQIVKHATFALDAQAGVLPEQWASRERLTITPGQDVWLTPLGFRVVLPSQADVEVAMSWEWFVRTYFVGSAGPTYPNSTNGTAATAGWFSLFRARRYDGDGASVADAMEEATITRNQVNPLEGDALDFSYYDATLGDVRTYQARGALLWRATLAAGTWDFALGYVGPTAPVDGLLQIDVSGFSGTLEALL